jgi:hypothetical protein
MTTPDTPTRIQEVRMAVTHIPVHLAHCYQGENEGVCKYGDGDQCPAKPDLVPCESCGQGIKPGEATRWADDILTCPKCSPTKEEARIQAVLAKMEEKLAQRVGMNVLCYSDPDDAGTQAYRECIALVRGECQ